MSIAPDAFKHRIDAFERRVQSGFSSLADVRKLRICSEPIARLQTAILCSAGVCPECVRSEMNIRVCMGFRLHI